MSFDSNFLKDYFLFTKMSYKRYQRGKNNTLFFLMASLITHHFAFYFLITTIIFSINFYPSIAEIFTPTITNTTPNVVTIQCKLNGISLKKGIINPMGDVCKINVPIYDDKENILWCAMSTKNKSGNFKIFDYKRDQKFCVDNYCDWFIRTDKICLTTVGILDCALAFKWWILC